MRTPLIVACLLAGALAATADERLDGLAASIDAAGASPTSEAATVEKLARFLGTPAPALRAQRAPSGLGWGDFFVAHRIASRGGHPVEKVIAARKTGASWAVIADEARVDEALLLQDVAAALPETATAPAPGGAARPAGAPASRSAPEEKKPPSLTDRLLDFFRGKPGPEPADDRTPDREAEEIRDRMLRGGGRAR
ncbi:MAG: hypothetical protein AAB418_08375 [candidate division NC10 bacterium]|jgi:hypothetical protein